MSLKPRGPWVCEECQNRAEEGDEAEEEDQSGCEICGQSHSLKMNKLLTCDGCEREFHKKCVGLRAIPKGRWLCRDCQEREDAANDNDGKSDDDDDQGGGRGGSTSSSGKRKEPDTDSPEDGKPPKKQRTDPPTKTPSTGRSPRVPRKMIDSDSDEDEIILATPQKETENPSKESPPKKTPSTGRSPRVPRKIIHSDSDEDNSDVETTIPETSQTKKDNHQSSVTTTGTKRKPQTAKKTTSGEEPKFNMHTPKKKSPLQSIVTPDDVSDSDDEDKTDELQQDEPTSNIDWDKDSDDDTVPESILGILNNKLFGKKK
jgi:hypothetical protein